MENEPFDLLLRGGHVICPASQLNGVMDVAIRDGRIAAVQPDILPSSAKEVVDVRGRLVLPGMIDTHAHSTNMSPAASASNADMVGVHSGVTTLVDQGGPSCMTFPGFRHFVAEPAQDPGLCIPVVLSRGRAGRTLSIRTSTVRKASTWMPR